MNCEVCGNELIEGLVCSASTVFFTTKKPRQTFHIVPRGEDITLTIDNWTLPNGKAWCCPRCKKIFINYQ